MLPGSPRRVRELGRGDRDGYAWSYVGGESKWRGRLNWTSARKAVAREHDPIKPQLRQFDGEGKGELAWNGGRKTLAREASAWSSVGILDLGREGVKPFKAYELWLVCAAGR